MMIDCGTWSGSKEDLTPFIEDLKKHVDNKVDLLVVTHEHKDHVHGFDVCEELLSNGFTIEKTWMAWTENDSVKKVKNWQKKYGDKKKVLALAADKLKDAANDPAFVQQMAGEYNGMAIAEAKKNFADVVSNFNALHVDKDAAGQYIGGLAGMKVAKEISKEKIEYLSPGDVIENLPNLEGIRFYVLGPPLSWDDVRVQEGGKGESYDHNKELAKDDAFAAVFLSSDGKIEDGVLPFDKHYESGNANTLPATLYTAKENDWRKIETDWLDSAGALALRINSITNNLSLALAIEFKDSGRIMLFPGDAEYGSWASWHNIKWNVPSRNKGVPLTEDILNRTVFYKVSHHLSHHGTAERLGMQMMTNPELVAMATLDYSIISNQWKSTMPNRALLKALVEQCKGRLMVMNPDGLFFDTGNTISLADKIKSERKKMSAGERDDFNKSSEEKKLYLQFTVSAK